ncbi:hypothetical protein [Streptomyces megasporus]|uniref:hypothetical protein n=1 Tax=Streptomyces megasporus TaxID=44060 RepID=UPI0004E1397D|nr:hypothetical protein [Streptomyces megasporus]
MVATSTAILAVIHLLAEDDELFDRFVNAVQAVAEPRPRPGRDEECTVEQVATDIARAIRPARRS